MTAFQRVDLKEYLTGAREGIVKEWPKGISEGISFSSPSSFSILTFIHSSCVGCKHTVQYNQGEEWTAYFFITFIT
jgi:hypothetical protein